MTSSATNTFNDALELAGQHERLQMWKAAQLVSAHVKVKEGRAEVLECLGLSDVVPPDSK